MCTGVSSKLDLVTMYFFNNSTTKESMVSGHYEETSDEVRYSIIKLNRFVSPSALQVIYDSLASIWSILFGYSRISDFLSDWRNAIQYFKPQGPNLTTTGTMLTAKITHVYFAFSSFINDFTYVFSHDMKWFYSKWLTSSGVGVTKSPFVNYSVSKIFDLDYLKLSFGDICQT